MKKVGYIYDDIFLEHRMPPGHPESTDRLVAINDALRRAAFWNNLNLISPKKASREDILAVHNPSYYDRVLSFTGYFDPDTFVSERTVEAAHFAAGAVIEAVRRCRNGEIERAFCAVRPPGHHAEAGRAMGFCIFNNVAIGARYAQKAGYHKVFIVDFDVHHGNGTQHIFEDDDSVSFFSTHEYPHYPGTGGDMERGKGRGEGFTYNVPMRHGSGDKEYYTAFNDFLPSLIDKFEPDIIIVSAGYDLHAADPLAGLRVTNEGIRSIVRAILLSRPHLPYIFCLEGGYNLKSLAESVVITMEELLGC